MHKTLILIFLYLTIVSCKVDSSSFDYTSWEVYGGGYESIRYSSLDQINTRNVSELQVAWTYHTGDADPKKNSQIQCNSIIIEDVLFCTSPRLKLFAVDAATGVELWSFNPFADTTNINHIINNNRGVTYWADDEGKNGRIFFTAGSYLYAIDARTGLPVSNFGDNGKSSLKQGLQGDNAKQFVTATSPGIVYEDLIIIGSRVSEGPYAAPGHIRAYNTRTGKLEWTFHTIPQPGEFGYDTWKDPQAWKTMGGANSWAGMSLDIQRGIVYIPTGSASPDFYGGERKGANLFANSLLALNAATGERVWHFQTIHHDLWDRDLPSPPSLVRVSRDGRTIDAVAQTTKTGYVFLFDRETGEPLFPIEERPVPTESELEGEEVWPTQPVPAIPAPFVRQSFGEDDINPYASKEEQHNIGKRLREMDNHHLFAPPSLNGTLMLPGFDGGAEWGGSAFDPATGILYVNSNEVPTILKMVENRDYLADNTDTDPYSLASGRSLYRTHCMSCHGVDRQGSGNNPNLRNIEQDYQPDELLQLVNNGRRMMPAFRHLEGAQKKSIVNYLINETHYRVSPKEPLKRSTSGPDATDVPYLMTGYENFETTNGYPANSPPWGTLNAINLNTGEYIWRIPLGEYPELKARGIPPTGTPNYGGPVVTAGGLVFIAATPDKKIRAFDKVTGELMWEAELPAAGFATPSIYEVNGKQYLIIAAGGGKLNSRSGDTYVAFSLPE